MFSYNQEAVRIIKENVLPRSEELRIGVQVLDNGATVIDMGINYPGSWNAARYFVQIGLGGRGEVKYGKMEIAGYLVPTIGVYVTRPVITEMSSHVAYWKLKYKDQSIVISGPIRAIKAPDVFAQAVSYREPHGEYGVAMIQTTELPGPDLADLIAREAGVPAAKLYILAAGTGTIVGAVQVAARNVEQTLPSLYDRGFKMNNIIQAFGIAPVVAIVSDEMEAYGRVNDCLIYGQETILWVDCEDGEIEKVLADLPFNKNSDVYGVPFKELFARCGGSWAKVPRDWDAPAKVTFFNVRSGRSYATGSINNKVLLNDFWG
ncbi:Methenyltetrahydromethanopterin cyclohydrolase [Neomoorella glycerini]|uniref:Methenyltetrahydromethanopterin cyclohydrolase n=1 Tax=Neomoorella glycerini TaxID=55779 RepID=A0A6I5ZMI3_9FIRM|nr:methenyltetrahydromethanopterin cyclohydrolase [Moorella glycerini]QGP91093.1 Methenyltetrahydromethanopterin cyclohydrolase [Moorella glycerini]